MTDREFGFMLKIAEHRHAELMGLLKEAVNPRMAHEMGRRQSPAQNVAAPPVRTSPNSSTTAPRPRQNPTQTPGQALGQMWDNFTSDPGVQAINRTVDDASAAVGRHLYNMGDNIVRGFEARDVRTNPYYQRAEEERKRNAALVEAQKQQAKTTQTPQTPQAPQGSLLSRVDAIRKEKATESAKPTVSGHNGPTEAPVNGRREDWLSHQTPQPWRRNPAAFNRAAGLGTTLAPATFSRPTLIRPSQNTGTGIFQNGVEVPRNQIGRSPWEIAMAPQSNAGVNRQLSRVRRAATSV